VYDLRGGIPHVLDVELDRAFDAVQIIVDACSCKHEKRGGRTMQIQLKRNVPLEFTLDFADCGLSGEFV
jgi:hypothetical protein